MTAGRVSAPPDGCPPPEALARRADGDLAPGERAAVEAHLERCARCRATARELEMVTRLLGRDPLPEGVPDLAPLVVARAELPPPRRDLLRPALHGLSLAAALCVGVLVGPRLLRSPDGPARGDDPAFQARGAGDNPDRWVALHPYLATEGGGIPLGEGAIVGPQPLLFAYDNGGPAPYPYLVVVGLDAAGAVLRYFPDDHPGAHSIAAESGRARELPEEVCFTPPAGPLRLVAIWSRAPLLVDEVARAARQAAPGERLALPGTGQHAVTVTVGAARPGARLCGAHGR